MVRWCCQKMLMVLGAALLLGALVPFVALLRVPEPYATEWVSAKLLMLPVGAGCLLAAMVMGAKSRR